MRRRALELLLVLALVVGGTMAWSTNRERDRLEVDYRRLVRATGDLPIDDPSKVHIRAIPTGEPLHFAWRVYLPPNSRFLHKNSRGHSSLSSSGSQEFIARVRFREDQGVLYVYDHFHGGSSRANLGGKALADLLRGRWEEIQVEQLGSRSVAAIDPDDPAIFLRLTMSEELQADARKMLSADENQEFNPVLFMLEIGPERPKPGAKPSGK